MLHTPGSGEGRGGTDTGRVVPPGAWADLLPLALLWFLPPLFIWLSLVFFHGEARTLQLRDERTAIAETFREFEQSREPVVQAGLYLSERGAAVVAPEADRTAARSFEKDIRELFPGATYLLFRPRRQVRSLPFSFNASPTLLLSAKDLEVVATAGLATFPLDAEELLDVSTLLYHNALLEGAPAQTIKPYALVEELAGPFFMIQQKPYFKHDPEFRHSFRIRDALLASKGMTIPFRLSGKSFYFYWNLFRQPPEKAAGPRSLPVFGVLLFIPPAELGQRTGQIIMGRRLAALGWNYAFLPRSEHPGPEPLLEGIAPDCPLWQEAQETYREATTAQGVFGEGTIDLGEPQRLILHSRATSEEFTHSLLGIFPACFAIWALLGYFFLGSPGFSMRVFSSLRRTMVLIFSMVMIPALIIASLQVETRFREKRQRLAAEQENRAGEVLEGFAQGIDLVNAYLINLLRRLSDDEIVDIRLAEFLAAGKVVEQFEDRGPLEFLYYQVFDHGLLLDSVMLIGSDWKTTLAVEPALFEVLGEIRGALLRAMGETHTGGQKSADAGEAVDKAFSRKALKFEEVQNVLRSLFSARDFAHFYLGPESLFPIHLRGNRDLTIYTKNLLGRNGRRKILQSRWHADVPFHALLRDWNHCFRLHGGEKFSLGVCEEGKTGWRAAPPFGYNMFPLPPGEPLHYTLRAIAEQENDVARLCVLAERSGHLTSRTFGTELRARTIMATPIGNHGRTVFCVYEPEKVLVVARNQAWQSRLFLSFAAFLALVLAFSSAAGFLRPLLQLNQAAEAIMKQDFTVRVPVESNNEFGLLAASFNDLAEGAEQGRFLSRFVSDSVRETVQDDRHEEIRSDGEALEAVILFASLGAFKERLKNTAPEELVIDLNAFFELAAKIVTESGGEINKFIGDKVLAVFYPRKLGDTSGAVSGALQAAMAMQARLPHAWEGTPLGVGLVTGRVLAGILGAADLRLEYTVIGDRVNFASRLCDMALRYDGGIVMDEASRSRLGESPATGWTLDCLGEVAVKGKSERKVCYRLSPSSN